MNSKGIAAALRILADAIEAPADNGALNAIPPAVPAAEAPASTKRGRGRPAKGEDVAASAPVQASSTTSPTPASAEDDPFASPAAPAAPTATIDQVRAALTALKNAVNQDVAVGVLKTAGGVDNLTALPPEKYGLVVSAATAKQLEYQKAPAVEADPFETPAAAPVEVAKVYTIEDVKAVVIETTKRTGTDIAQKVVMDHGGKAPSATGGFVASLKALPAERFAETIAALKALPTTK